MNQPRGLVCILESLLSSLISPSRSLSLSHLFSSFAPFFFSSLSFSFFFTGESLKVKRSHGLYSCPLPFIDVVAISPRPRGGVRRCRLILRGVFLLASLSSLILPWFRPFSARNRLDDERIKITGWGSILDAGAKRQITINDEVASAVSLFISAPLPRSQSTLSTAACHDVVPAWLASSLEARSSTSSRSSTKLTTGRFDRREEKMYHVVRSAIFAFF